MWCHHSQLALNLIATACLSAFLPSLVFKSGSHINAAVDPQCILSASNSLSCHKSAGQLLRNAAHNKITKHGIDAAGFPSQLRPIGLDQRDGKKPGGMTISLLCSDGCIT